MTRTISTLFSENNRGYIVLVAHRETLPQFNRDGNWYNKSQAPSRYQAMLEYLKQEGLDIFDGFEKTLANTVSRDTTWVLWGDLERRLNDEITDHDILCKYNHMDVMELATAFAVHEDLYWNDSLHSEDRFDVTLVYPNEDSWVIEKGRNMVSCWACFGGYPSDVSRLFVKTLGWRDVNAHKHCVT